MAAAVVRTDVHANAIFQATLCGKPATWGPVAYRHADAYRSCHHRRNIGPQRLLATAPATTVSL